MLVRADLGHAFGRHGGAERAGAGSPTRPRHCHPMADLHHLGNDRTPRCPDSSAVLAPVGDVTAQADGTHRYWLDHPARLILTDLAAMSTVSGETSPQPSVRLELARALGISDQALSALLSEPAEPECPVCGAERTPVVRVRAFSVQEDLASTCARSARRARVQPRSIARNLDASTAVRTGR